MNRRGRLNHRDLPKPDHPAKPGAPFVDGASVGAREGVDGWSQWDRFWYLPLAHPVLGWTRRGVCGVAVAWLVMQAFWFWQLQSDRLALPNAAVVRDAASVIESPQSHGYSLLDWTDRPWVLGAASALSAALLLASGVVGWGSRWLSVLGWVLMVGVTCRTSMAMGSDAAVMNLAVGSILCMLPAATMPSRWSDRHGRVASSWNRLSFRLLTLHVLVLVVGRFLAQWGERTWRDGEAASLLLSRHGTAIGDVLSMQTATANGMTLMALWGPLLGLLCLMLSSRRRLGYGLFVAGNVVQAWLTGAWWFNAMILVMSIAFAAASAEGETDLPDRDRSDA
jgi:hypothetical protein